MPAILDKVVAAAHIAEAVSAIASYRRKDKGYVEHDLASELSHGKLKARTLKSWQNSTSIPNTIDDGAFFGIVYLGLKTGQLKLNWLMPLLEATSVPLYKPPSRLLLSAYLKQARLQGKPIPDTDINDVLDMFFEDEDSVPQGLAAIHKRGSVGKEPLQTLIPLEPITREFILHSRQISMEGLSLFRFVEAFFPYYLEAAKNGTLIRVVLVSPEEPIINMVAYRSSSQVSVDVERQRFANTIDTLFRINQRSNTNAVQIRTLEYMPPYGITAYQHEDESKSACLVRLYTFRTPTTEAPAILSTPLSYSKWHKFFTEQFELMWRAALPVEAP